MILRMLRNAPKNPSPNNSWFYFGGCGLFEFSICDFFDEIRASMAMVKNQRKTDPANVNKQEKSKAV